MVLQTRRYHCVQFSASYKLAKYLAAPAAPSPVKMGLQPFETRFAVPLHCQSCVDEVSAALNAVPGVNKITADLQKETITISGTAAPSSIVTAIQGTGRDAILRGSGTGSDNTAAVCILETHENVEDPVRGLARMVQVSDNSTIIDLTLRGVPSGEHAVSIRKAGDISLGAASMGSVWEGPRGALGTILVDKSGLGSRFVVLDAKVWELIGRGMVVERVGAPAGEEFVGVIARSAGLWDNEKTVCSCSGKTLWEERRDNVKKGVV